MKFSKTFVFLTTLICSTLIVSAQIQAGRAINITIAGVPDAEKAQITNAYPVSDNGVINMPYIGQVRAAGLRNEQLAAILESRYRQSGIYRNPTIQVITNTVNGEVNQESVTIGGQVRKTGPIPFTKELTLWQAIQSAGGPTEFGSMKRVRLTREGQTKEYNLKKPQFQSISLQRNDAIEIPEKNPFGG